jgi:CDP-glucose 4,6-dehydratase
MKWPEIRAEYHRRRVLITGATGFKGSWLAAWLHQMGAQVLGLADGVPTSPALWDQVVDRIGLRWVPVDIRDARIGAIVEEFSPDVVFHMAASPLVMQSYAEPLETVSVNVLGTLNVLEAVRGLRRRVAVVCVSSDKCYENDGTGRPLTEDDRLGGSDPYSASKAAMEIVVASYRATLLSEDVRIATVRAGNVLGGGDWARHRLIPDCMRAVMANRAIALRSPSAIRPWQHVLDCLAGYIEVGALLVATDQSMHAAWNFGPLSDDGVRVASIVETFLKHLELSSWPVGVTVEPAAPEHPTLRLDITRAIENLDWRPRWGTDEMLRRTARWYSSFWRDPGGPGSIDQLFDDIHDYECAAKSP